MNHERLTAIKNIVNAIVPPFATAAMVLLIVLSLLEYFRRGFVSLFLDFRLVAVVALVLWGVAVVAEADYKRRRLSLILPTVALIAALPVLYRMILPFGRLGLVVFGAGVAVVVLIILALVRGGETRTMDSIQ